MIRVSVLMANGLSPGVSHLFVMTTSGKMLEFRTTISGVCLIPRSVRDQKELTFYAQCIREDTGVLWLRQTLELPDDVAEIPLRYPVGSRVRGKLVDEEGGELARQRLQFAFKRLWTPTSERELAIATKLRSFPGCLVLETDPLGNFELNSLSPEFGIQVLPMGVSNGHFSVSTDLTLVGPPNLYRCSENFEHHLQISLSSFLSRTVECHDASGRPISSALVTLLFENGFSLPGTCTMTCAVTNEIGVASLQLPVGTNNATTDPLGQKCWVAAYHPEAGIGYFQGVLAAGAPLGIDFAPLDMAKSTEITLLDSVTETPIENVELVLFSDFFPSQLELRSTTGSDGRATWSGLSCPDPGWEPAQADHFLFRVRLPSHLRSLIAREAAERGKRGENTQDSMDLLRGIPLTPGQPKTLRIKSK
ncbi:MAG: hypothetical protein AAB074_16865 [Planctomycetota bacterium]